VEKSSNREAKKKCNKPLLVCLSWCKIACLAPINDEWWRWLPYNLSSATGSVDTNHLFFNSGGCSQCRQFLATAQQPRAALFEIFNHRS